MFIGSIILAAAILMTPVSLEGGDLTVKIPANVSVVETHVNWETNRYTLIRTSNHALLLTIFVGGGSYDLRHYSKFCLNSRGAWRLQMGGVQTVIAGSPGVNSVYASTEHVLSKNVGESKKILETITYNEGKVCQ